MSNHLRVVTETEALGVAWARLQAEVDRRRGMTSTASWIKPDGVAHHQVTVHGFNGHEMNTGIRCISDDLAEALTEVHNRLTHDDWDT